MNITRRDFLLGAGTLAAGAALAHPIRSVVGSANSGYAIDDSPIPTAEDYIQDGLVSLWDCIENVGLGEHNPDSTEWIDLVAGRKFTQVAFESDCACVVQATRGCSFNAFHFDSTSTELVCCRLAGSTQNHSFQSAQYVRINGTAGARGFSAQRYPIKNRQYIGTMHTAVITDAVPEEVNYLASTFEYVDGIGYSKYFLNGRQIDAREWQQEIEFYSMGIYNSLSPNNRFFRISLYDRVLGADEIAYNYDIDSRRFGL